MYAVIRSARRHCRAGQGDTHTGGGNMKSRRLLPALLCTAAGIAAGLLTVPLLYAQDNFPSKPLRFIVPYPPGGSSDVLARVIAQKLTEGLGRQVIIENRPGAAGNIGHELAAKAPADGYTLLLTTKSQMVTNS